MLNVRFTLIAVCATAMMLVAGGCHHEMVPQLFAPMKVVDAEGGRPLEGCLLVQESWERETFHGGGESDAGEYSLRRVQLWTITPGFIFNQPAVTTTCYPGPFVYTTIDRKYLHIILNEGYAPTVLNEEQVASILRQDRVLVVELFRKPAPPKDTRLEEPYYMLQQALPLVPISDPLRARFLELRENCPGAKPPQD